MQVFRIAQSHHIKDLTGGGAKLYGGRWNPKGIAMIYTASSRALATIEVLVHVPMDLIPKNLSLATIEISDLEVPEDIKKLPARWRDYPGSSKLKEMGKEWILSNRTLLLRVPSAVVKNEYNMLINPNHPNIRRVKIVDIQRYFFDERLLRIRH